MKAAWACLFLVGEGARFRHAKQGANGEVSIAGVPVHNYKPNSKDWIVLFKPGTSTASIDAFCGDRCSFRGNPDEGGMAFAKVRGGEVFMEGMLSHDSDNAFLVEADEMMYAIPDVEVQEQSRNTPRSWGLSAIGVQGRGATGKGTHIYVQDTGIRTTHIDFGGRAVGALDMTIGGEQGTVCTGDAPCAADVQGHGSHCAGSAAGETLGVAPDARIYAIKTLSDQGSGEMSWQYGGIDFVATKGKFPAVLSMSLGGQGVQVGFDAALEALTKAGVTAVAAAGNSNSDTCGFSPAFSTWAISVGATGEDNKRASYSNYGRCNQIMAPGSAIVSVDANFDTRTKKASGTSMACPHVSGAVALLMERDPEITFDQVLNSLTNSSVQNLISGLKQDDPNYFLWVSDEPAASPAPTPAPVPNSDCPGYCSEQYCWWGDCKNNCDYC
jgi:subtilisin family serine protease